MNSNKKSFILQLGDFCIETTAKKRYRELAEIIINDDGKHLQDMQNELLLLTGFLNHTDFKALRSNNPAFCGSHNSCGDHKLLVEITKLDNVEFVIKIIS